MIYVDSSALLKRYVEEPDSDYANELLASDSVLVTSWITLVELRRNVARLVEPSSVPALMAQITADLDGMALVSVDEVVCESADDAVGEAEGSPAVLASGPSGCQWVGSIAVSAGTAKPMSSPSDSTTSTLAESACAKACLGVERLVTSAGMKLASTRLPVIGSKAITRSLVESGTRSNPVVSSIRRARAEAAGSRGSMATGAVVSSPVNSAASMAWESMRSTARG